MASAKLVGYTQPSAELAREFSTNPDLLDLVAYMARVSNPSNQYNQETAQKLVNFLVRNGHWSPLEMVNVVLEITTTRDIAHQIVRHRSFSFQEFSQRYADPTKDLSLSCRKARLQDTKNRQNSIEIDNLDDRHRQWDLYQWRVSNISKKAYNWAIDNGIAKEQARAVLPEGMTESRLYMNGTLRSWLHYIQLRSGNGTQKEHQDVALACSDVVSSVFPMLKDYVGETR